MGAWADLRAAKKRLLVLHGGLRAGHRGAGRRGPGDLWLAVVAIVLSNLFYAYGESLIAAFLPELARATPSAASRAGAGASATSAAC
jgi:MFS transporter, UMF1 family